MSFGSVISAAKLRSALHDVHVIDLRWALDDPGKGRRDYEAGHIPGAVFVDLEDVTGERGTGTGREGRHPLPSRERFEDVMRAAGVNVNAKVVVYDDASGSVASRLWWLLRAFGHADVVVLDGGIQAWGDDLETGSREVERGDFVASGPDLSSVVPADDVLATDGATLIDVRSGERYRGEMEPVDPIAGHIPGAKNAFWQEAVVADGVFRSPDEVKERFAAYGHDLIVYCGSGVVASQTVLQLERAGFKPRLYAGGWSEWSERATRDEVPVATGDGSDDDPS